MTRTDDPGGPPPGGARAGGPPAREPVPDPIPVGEHPARPPMPLPAAIVLSIGVFSAAYLLAFVPFVLGGARGWVGPVLGLVVGLAAGAWFFLAWHRRTRRYRTRKRRR